MKKYFLNALNLELRPLRKEERKKCLNDYEEIILDKMENGMTEEQAVSDLGSVKQSAKDILNSYVELDRGMIKDIKKYFNRMYLVFDGIVLVISYLLALLAYYTFFKDNFLGVDFRVSLYISALLYILPCYLILYYVFKLYTVKCVKEKHREALNIFGANVAGLVLLTSILYFSGQIFFSRMMLSMFVFINTILGIITRNFIFSPYSLLNNMKYVSLRKIDRI